MCASPRSVRAHCEEENDWNRYPQQPKENSATHKSPVEVTLGAGEATPAARARMYAGVGKEVGGCLLLPDFAHAPATRELVARPKQLIAAQTCGLEAADRFARTECVGASGKQNPSRRQPVLRRHRDGRVGMALVPLAAAPH